MHEPGSLVVKYVVAAGRRGASDAHQLYGARLSCHLMRFGVTVWAAGYAQPVDMERPVKSRRIVYVDFLLVR